MLESKRCLAFVGNPSDPSTGANQPINSKGAAKPAMSNDETGNDQ